MNFDYFGQTVTVDFNFCHVKVAIFVCHTAPKFVTYFQPWQDFRRLDFSSCQLVRPCISLIAAPKVHTTTRCVGTIWPFFCFSSCFALLVPLSQMCRVTPVVLFLIVENCYWCARFLRSVVVETRSGCRDVVVIIVTSDQLSSTFLTVCLSCVFFHKVTAQHARHTSTLSTEAFKRTIPSF